MSRKLLLADDSVTVQRVIELTFADEGVQVVSVSDGSKAIARLEEERPDIVLADASMRGFDGYQLSEHIKSNPATTHVPVVLMTGAFEPLDEERARRVRCDAVLTKPFEPQMAISLVQQLLSGAGAAAVPAPPTSDAEPPAVEPVDATVATVAPAVDPPAAAVPTSTRPAVPKTLDDYLERLDDALTQAATPLSLRALDDLGALPRPPGVAPAPPVSFAPKSMASSGLAEAFSSLLEEELGDATLPGEIWEGLADQTTAAAAPKAPAAVPLAVAPSSAVAPPPPAVVPVVTDDMIAQIARRVAVQLTDASIRDIVSQRVIEIAERLVREEIDRIKGSAR